MVAFPGVIKHLEPQIVKNLPLADIGRRPKLLLVVPRAVYSEPIVRPVRLVKGKLLLLPAFLPLHDLQGLK